MRRRTPSPRRSNRLQLERLEPRENPSGVVKASLAAGVLTLTGDDNNNNITIQVTGTGATITPNAGETINVIGSLTGTVKSINAVMKGGNDTVTIDTALSLTGGAAFNLGSGNNFLTLGTGAVPIDIGGNLTVRGGDGSDNVTVFGNGIAAGQSRVGGGVNLALGLGPTIVNLQNYAVNGTAGVKLSAGEGDDGVILNHLDVQAGGVSVSSGAGLLMVTLTGAPSVHTRVNISGRSFVLVTANSGDYGSMSVTGGAFDTAALSVPGSVTVTGAVRIGGYVAATVVSGALDAGSLALSGQVSSQLLHQPGSSITVHRNLSVAAQQSAVATLSGAALAVTGSVAITASDSASAAFNTTGPATVGGNVTITGPHTASTSFTSTDTTTVTGNLTVNGGIGNDSVTINPFLSVGKNVLLNLKGGDNLVSVVGGGTAATVGGNLSILTGAGRDTVTLTDAEVEGMLNVRLGAGGDTLTMLDGTTVTGTTFVSLGAGDDLLNVATLPGALVTLTGMATLNTGAGNDSVTLAPPGQELHLGTTPIGGVLNLGFGIDTDNAASANITGGTLTVNDLP